MEKTKVLFIERLNDAFEVEIPESYKVTFGAHKPGSKTIGTKYDGGIGVLQQDDSLRIYRATNNQVACFRHVVAFHEKSLNIKKVPQGQQEEDKIG